MLSGGGKFNYFGTKGLLEDLDGSDASSLLSSAEYTLCLDSLSTTSTGDLFLHVSKPPREGSRAHHLFQALNQVSCRPVTLLLWWWWSSIAWGEKGKKRLFIWGWVESQLPLLPPSSHICILLNPYESFFMPHWIFLLLFFPSVFDAVCQSIVPRSQPSTCAQESASEWWLVSMGTWAVLHEEIASCHLLLHSEPQGLAEVFHVCVKVSETVV